MNRILISSALIGMFFGPACLRGIEPASELSASTSEGANGKLPALDGRWSIKMTQSGGIMGLNRSIEVLSTAGFTVRDENASRLIRGQLTQDELRGLVLIVNSSMDSPKKGPSGCADCFVYDIEIVGNDRRFAAELDDPALDDSGLQSVISALRHLIERELI